MSISDVHSLLDMHFLHGVDGQYVLDADADLFIKVNPAFCELVGYSNEQLVEASRPVSSISFVHRDDREVVRNHRAGSREAGQSGIMRYRVLRPDGELRHIEARYSIMEYEGRLVEAGSARDISEQIKLEHKLRNESEFNRELTLAAQRAARDTQKKSIEVLESNTRLGSLTEVLRTVPVLTKRLLELSNLDDVYRETTFTIVNDAQFSSCAVYLTGDNDELALRYANPYREPEKNAIATNPVFRTVMKGMVTMAVDDDGDLVAPIRTDGAVRGLLQVGIPAHMRKAYLDHKSILQALNDVVVTVADYLGVVISNHENLKRIELQSRTDKLTGLLNRRVFEEQLAIEFRRSSRYERGLSLLFIDIDHFKVVNDTHGHQQGDEVLERVGEKLKSSFRDLDTVCRYGGEEFCAILPETSAEDAVNKAEQVRREVEMMRIERLNTPGEDMSITISVGVASVNKGTANEDQLLRDSDEALFYCKEHGRNQVKLADV